MPLLNVWGARCRRSVVLDVEDAPAVILEDHERSAQEDSETGLRGVFASPIVEGTNLVPFENSLLDQEILHGTPDVIRHVPVRLFDLSVSFAAEGVEERDVGDENCHLLLLRGNTARNTIQIVREVEEDRVHTGGTLGEGGQRAVVHLEHGNGLVHVLFSTAVGTFALNLANMSTYID